MKTTHKIIFGNSKNLEPVPKQSVDLVVTSPPYPMIEMWDEIFSKINPEIKRAIEEEKTLTAFELMHKELDKVWDEINRILKPGSIICVNIGDATRKIGNNFCLYPNHSRIIEYFQKLNYDCLPSIIWRKQTNAPNKFMGSGMLPPGAYVTLEHEYILIFRKGNKRKFLNQKDKTNRQESAFFWEERNVWFSDLWDFKGIGQQLKSKLLREKSAAYPFELAYRLINMFSVKGDTVIDPFLGTGTTVLAAMTAERNSVGIEIDQNFKDIVFKRITEAKDYLNNYIEKRILNHLKFVEERKTANKPIKYTNSYHGFPVMTKQEINLKIRKIKKIKKIGDNTFETYYFDSEND